MTDLQKLRDELAEKSYPGTEVFPQIHQRGFKEGFDAAMSATLDFYTQRFVDLKAKHDAELAEKDARIAELEAALKDKSDVTPGRRLFGRESL